MSELWLSLGELVIEKEHKRSFWGANNVPFFDLGTVTWCIQFMKKSLSFTLKLFCVYIVLQ